MIDYKRLDAIEIPRPYRLSAVDMFYLYREAKNTQDVCNSILYAYTMGYMKGQNEARNRSKKKGK